MNPKNSSNLDSIKSMSLPKSRFTEMLIAENALGQRGFEHWIFCPGMFFDSIEKWWGDHGRRDYPHEGLDLCLYQDHCGKTLRIDEKTRIPVMHDGVVRAVSKDYLGQTIIIQHKAADSNTAMFISFYAHVKPHANINVGDHVKEGDIIATLGETSHSKARIIPHLHFSLGLPSESFTFDRFVWDTIRNPEMITLLDPLPVLGWPYKKPEAENPVCRKL